MRFTPSLIQSAGRSKRAATASAISRTALPPERNTASTSPEAFRMSLARTGSPIDSNFDRDTPSGRERAHLVEG